MKWIYGAVMSVADTVIRSYKVNPSDIVAVDFNRQTFISRELGELKYHESEEDLIIKLVGEEENEVDSGKVG